MRAKGERYDPKLSVREIAARIRRDVAEAARVGELPALVVSVRLSRGSLSSSIDVRVTGVPEGFPVVNPSSWRLGPGNTWTFIGVARERYAPRLRAALDVLERIRGAYNYDKSEPSTDYSEFGYYGGVEVDPVLEETELARLASPPGVVA